MLIWLQRHKAARHENVKTSQTLRSKLRQRWAQGACEDLPNPGKGFVDLTAAAQRGGYQNVGGVMNCASVRKSEYKGPPKA